MVVSAHMEDRISRNQADILSFLRRRAPSEAEELAQETWLRVARSSPNCPTEGHFRAFAFTVARRLVVDHYRRRANQVHMVPIEGGTLVDRANPHENATASQTLVAVESILGAMKPEIAQVFRWRTTSDLSFKDIATRQQVSLNTALGRMHSAVNKIRAGLLEAGLLEGGTHAL